MLGWISLAGIKPRLSLSFESSAWDLFFLLEKIEDNLIYSDVLSTTKNKLYYLLSSNKKLKIIDKNNFIVNDINIHGNNYGIMIFT